MKTKNFVILLVVAVVLCGVAIVVSQRQKPVSTDTTSDASLKAGRLFPGSSSNPQKADQIARIEYTKKDKKMVLTRGDQNNWQIESCGGYPADPSKVTRLVFDLTEITRVDRITDNPEKYAGLGVEGDVGEEGTILLADKSGGEIAKIILGKRREVKPDSESMSQPAGRYARVDADPSVLLIADNLWIDPEVRSWAKTDIMAVPKEEVVGIRIDHRTTATLDNETVNLVWDDGLLALKDVPKGMQARKTEVDSTRSALQGLRFDDVFQADSEKGKTIDFNTTFTATAKDGTIYTVRVAKPADKYYVALSASYGEPLFTADDNATTTGLAAAQQKAEKAKGAVPEFNAKHSKWIYELPQWAQANLARKRSELVEPIPTPTPVPTPAAKPAEGAEKAMQGAKPAVTLPRPAMAPPKPGVAPKPMTAPKPVATPKATPKAK